MRFTTQTTTTINPMIPRTNQTIRLISTSSSLISDAPSCRCLRLVVSYQPVLPHEPTQERRCVSLDTRMTPRGAARDLVVGLPPAGLLDARCQDDRCGGSGETRRP
jgi:hypothetical protein